MFLSLSNLGCLVLPLVFAAAPTLPAASPAVDADAIVAPQTSNRHEVRLRKLHLVRPDLIPYPIAYEVHC